MAIHIKKSHRGLLHKNLGIPEGQKIPASKLAIHSGDSTAVKKRKVFAQNAKKWHHQDGGALPTAYASAPRQLPFGQPQPMNMNLQGNDVAYGMNNSGVSPIDSYQSIDPTLQNNQAPNVGNDVSFYNQSTQGDPKQRRGYNGEYGQMALAGLLAVDKLLPNPKIHPPVVRPLTGYNPHPYGTGSQALMEYGGELKTSRSGYRANSPDRFESALRIPSNNISMEGVDHPVLGVDNTGYTQMMQPGEHHYFPGTEVDEYPMYSGGVLKNRHSYQAGGEITRMNADQINHFNNFNDFVKGKGLQGSTKLNTGTLNEDLYRQYNDSLKVQNPVPLRQLTRMAQNEQHYQKDFDVDFAQRKAPDRATAIAQSSISPIDDFYGSETSKRYIPVAERINNNNNQIVSKQNLGFVPNSLNKPTVAKYKTPVPDWAEIIDTNEGKGYFNQDMNFVKLNYGGKMKPIKVYQEGGLLNDHYKKGSTHDMSDSEIKSLLSQGYKLKFV